MPSVVSVHWVVPEKIHTPMTDGILEILGSGVGGGGKDSGNFFECVLIYHTYHILSQGGLIL